MNLKIERDDDREVCYYEQEQTIDVSKDFYVKVFGWVVSEEYLDLNGREWTVNPDMKNQIETYSLKESEEMFKKNIFGASDVANVSFCDEDDEDWESREIESIAQAPVVATLYRR